MKALLFVTICSFVIMSNAAFSQNKIVIDDRASILNSDVEKALEKKFLEKNLYLTNSVDFKNKCDYYFSTIVKSESGYTLKVENCDNQLLGSVSAGPNLGATSDEEKAVIIFFNIWGIIDNPTYPASKETEPKTAETVQSEFLNSEHDSRYFFAPSALPVKEKELYYNSLYFLLHDIQYGVTDNLTVGMGTTIIGLPVYFTAKYSIPIAENSHLAFGDMLILGTYGTNFLGNLAYATYTYGDSHSNISFGGGHLYFDPDDNSEKSSSLVGNISGIIRAGKYFYFLTENYLFNFQTTEFAYRETQLPDGSFVYEEGQYNFKRNVWYGLTGIRFVRKTNELVSWQIGLTHVLILDTDVPAPYNSSSWNTNSFNDGVNFVTFPTLSFTRKFKL